MSRPYAYNLIGSAEVYDNLSSIEDIQVNALKESQLRELIQVPKEKRVDAWKAAVDQVGTKPITAKAVRQAASKFMEKKKEKAEKAGKAAKKASPAPIKPNLKPAFKLLKVIEKMAKKDTKLIKKLGALRKYLERIQAA